MPWKFCAHRPEGPGRSKKSWAVLNLRGKVRSADHAGSDGEGRGAE